MFLSTWSLRINRFCCSSAGRFLEKFNCCTNTCAEGNRFLAALRAACAFLMVVSLDLLALLLIPKDRIIVSTTTPSVGTVFSNKACA